jgi:hypothetical protein
MWYTICTQGNWGDSWPLKLNNWQFDSRPFFGHNLCFKYSNEICKFIWDIYVPKDFQWYKKNFNPMGFDLCNHSLKIQKSIGAPIFKVWAHLGVWRFIPSHSLTLSEAWNVTPRLHFWPTSSQAFALVVSPRLGLQQHEKLWHHLHLKWRILNMMKKMFSLFMGNKNNGLKPLLLCMKWSLIMIMLIWKEPMRRDHSLFNFNAFFTNQWFILLLMSKRNNVG